MWVILRIYIGNTSNLTINISNLTINISNLVLGTKHAMVENDLATCPLAPIAGFRQATGQPGGPYHPGSK
jgi:hypothetical protein